jgi:GNAT superfamily N-acetyltransferase
MNELELREAGPDDVPFLRRMTYEAAFWRPGAPRPDQETALAIPDIARYVEGWGRPGDAAVIGALGGAPVGAAWMRLFDAAAPGYGFVAPDIPEVAVAVESAHRGRGIATALLGELIRAAGTLGHARVSLSVNHDNPSARIYRRLGFRTVRADGDSWVMVRPPSASGGSG